MTLPSPEVSDVDCQVLAEAPAQQPRDTTHDGAAILPGSASGPPTSAPDTENETLPGLSRHWRRELLRRSSIGPDVIAERRYQTITWGLNDRRGHDILAELGIPSWARAEERGSGLLIPMYRATGERISVQWRPEKQIRKDGQYVKYVSVKGQASRLDVHPRNRDRIVDPTVLLWITEGIKKADALTSCGACVVALTGDRSAPSAAPDDSRRRHQQRRLPPPRRPDSSGTTGEARPGGEADSMIETTMPPWQAARVAVLLDALGGVPISDAERRSLMWLAGSEAHTVENVAAMITRARQTREDQQ
jgi:hypothetical protein